MSEARSIIRRVPGWDFLRQSRLARFLGYEDTVWVRAVTDRETQRLIDGLSPSGLDTLEVSGTVWANYGFRSYRSTSYPELDISARAPSELVGRYDLIIVEHVLEHVQEAPAAVRTMAELLRPGGHALVVTPFLYRVHHDPRDYTRWTPDGLAELLGHGGFDVMRVWSWGNRSCIQATMRREYIRFNRFLHSLENEPDWAMVVWTLARRGDTL